MDKLFDSPWVLRITALLLAVLLYFYVVSQENSNKTSEATTQTDVIMNVPLEVYYDDENLVVTGVPETVDVKISGPTTTVQRTKVLEDYKVFVDLNSLLIGEHSVTISTENFSEKLAVSVEPKMISVIIEEKVTREFKVEPEINSQLIAEDYVLKNMTVDPQRILITGAQSVIDNISYVKATVKGEQGIKESFSQDSNVIVLNRDLNKLDVSIEPQKVNVKVDVNQYSRDLPITLKQVGTPQEGITINSLVADPSRLTVYGTKVVLDSMKELVVNYDVSAIQTSGSETVKVELPEGVSKVSAEEIMVQADVTKEIVEESASTTEEVENDSQDE